MENITMKDLEGKEIFLMPTGNNVYRHGPNKVISAKLVKVARVYATFIKKSGIECKGLINGLHLDTGHNSGYQVFQNKQEIDDLLFVESTARKIANTFPYAKHYEKLDRDTITKVAVLLGIDITVQAIE